MKRKEINIQTGEVMEIDLTPEEIAEIMARPPVDMTPKSVTMRQARLALLNAGKLQAVNVAINQMQGIAGDAARIEWDYSNEVHRNRPLTMQLAQMIGMTPQEMDALFVEASTL